MAQRGGCRGSILLHTHLARHFGLLPMLLLTHGSGDPTNLEKGQDIVGGGVILQFPLRDCHANAARLPRDWALLRYRYCLGGRRPMIVAEGTGSVSPITGRGSLRRPTDQRQGSAASHKLDSETSVCSPAATIRAYGTVNAKQDQGRRNS